MVPREGSGATLNDDVCSLTATELARRIRSKDLSSRDVVLAHIERIERINPRVNAIVTLAAERALDEAAAADDALAHGRPAGVLHGLPIVHKDLLDTAGIRTTYGSRFFRDHVPQRDAAVVARSRAAGAISLGKTNTPEFGAGSQTFNAVFGATHNPYDLGKTCGGSSGGSAAALASGLAPLADGTDAGGSLRNPAAFCNVVGLRPSPGRVPSDVTPWSFSVCGPMARTVEDVALLLSAIAGPDPGSDISIADDAARFRQPLARSFKGVRVAWWRDLAGVPFEAEIRDRVDAARPVFADLGCVIDDAEPDFSGAADAFPVLRYVANYASYAAIVREKPEWVKDTIQFEVAQAERLTGADVGRALACRTRLLDESRRFFDRYEYFVLPVTQVMPFDVAVPYPSRIGDMAMTSYIDWMRSCWYVSFLSNPAISVPAGFSTSGLPIGLQIVGRRRDEWSVLQLAYAFEQATRHGERRPTSL